MYECHNIYLDGMFSYWAYQLLHKMDTELKEIGANTDSHAAVSWKGFQMRDNKKLDSFL